MSLVSVEIKSMTLTSQSCKRHIVKAGPMETWKKSPGRWIHVGGGGWSGQNWMGRVLPAGQNPQDLAEQDGSYEHGFIAEEVSGKPRGLFGRPPARSKGCGLEGMPRPKEKKVAATLIWLGLQG